MIGDPYEDRPASHAVHHATGEGPACWCDGPPPGDLWAIGAIAAVIGVFLLAVLL